MQYQYNHSHAKPRLLAASHKQRPPSSAPPLTLAISGLPPRRRRQIDSETDTGTSSRHGQHRPHRRERLPRRPRGLGREAGGRAHLKGEMRAGLRLLRRL